MAVLYGQLAAVDLEHGLLALHLDAIGAVRQNLGLLLVVGILRVRLADNAGVLQIHGGFGMVRQQIADGLDLAQAVDLALDYLQSGISENGVPGLGIVLVGHVIVGVITGNDHHGTEDDLFIARVLHHLHHVFRQRRGLHGADEVVDVSGVLEYLLHLGIDAVGIGGGAVAHPAHGGLAVLDGILGSVRHGLGCLGKVVIAGQQGRADLNGLELIGVLLLQQIAEVAVLIAVHQVSGLDQQVLYAALYGAVQSLLHIVDLLAVPAVDMLDDDVGGEAAADVIVGESLLQVVLNGLDGGYPAVVEAGAEADNQQFVLLGAVLVAGVVLGGVSGGVIVQIPAQDNGHLGTGRGAIGVQPALAGSLDELAGCRPVHALLGPGGHIGGVGIAGQLVYAVGQAVPLHLLGSKNVQNFGDLLAQDAAVRGKGIRRFSSDDALAVGPEDGVLIRGVIGYVCKGSFRVRRDVGGTGQAVQGQDQGSAGHVLVRGEGGRGLAVDQALFRDGVYVLLPPMLFHIGIAFAFRSEGGACQAQGQDHCQQQGQQFVPVSHSGLLLKYDAVKSVPGRRARNARGLARRWRGRIR